MVSLETGHNIVQHLDLSIERKHIKDTANTQTPANSLRNDDAIHPVGGDINSTFLDRVLVAMMHSTKAVPEWPRRPAVACKLTPNGSSASTPTTVNILHTTRPPVPPQTQIRVRNQKPMTLSSSSSSSAMQMNMEKIMESSSSALLNGTSDAMPLMKAASIGDRPDAIVADQTNGHTNNGWLKSARRATLMGDTAMAGRRSEETRTGRAEPSPIRYCLNLKPSHVQADDACTNGNGVERQTQQRTFTRSPSPLASWRGRGVVTSSSSALNPCTASPIFRTTPRRIFPQTYTASTSANLYEMRHLEPSPVIFDANLSFVLGCQKQPVHQSVRSSPSHREPQTSSAYLTEKIQNFLRRTDHVQEEWSALKRKPSPRCSDSLSRTASGSECATPTSSVYDDYDTISLIERQRERVSMERAYSVGRSRSAQNILTKAYQLTKTLPKTPRSRSNSVAKELPQDDDDDRTIHEENDGSDLDELSEMTIDLAEERSAANINAERLEAETAERLKLEKELVDQQNKVKHLQEASEKLEMELICAKSDLNGISEDEEHDSEEGVSAVYKLKYERVARELEFTKRRLHTQHEHDLEQLVGLKKQLEKKLADAYEEVEEQRQVVGQWKRKVQKMTNEMNDLRMLLEEQNVRNNQLEKKQRKFDSECQLLQDAARQERQAKDRLSREMDILTAEKFALEQSLSDTRLELDIKEEKLTSIQRELEELTFGGGTEEENAQLRRSKNELDRRVKEQDEELDELAGQVQLLEQAKLRLEMSLETMRKDSRREAQQRDEELEEARGSAYKKIKALECQLENEHEERTLLLREKHELERRLSSVEDQDLADRQAEEAANQKLRRDVRKFKALLKDAQTQLERLRAETPGKALVRQLRNDLEDAEAARTIAMKARQTAETELADVQAMLDETNRARQEAEEKASATQRDRAELQAQIEENEEELAELMRKYSTAVKQLNSEQIAASEYEFKLSELEAERNSLKDQVSELQQRLESIENLSDPSAAMMSKRLELRSKELESRLELEQATRTRLEVQVTRHKEALEKAQSEMTQIKLREKHAQDAHKKSQRSLRELREEFHAVNGREQESLNRRKDLEKKLEQAECDVSSLRNDLRLALQRIADLQQAMEEDDTATDSEESNSSNISLIDLEERLQPINVKRSSLTSNSIQMENQGNGPTMGVRGKDDSGPRVAIASPSTSNNTKITAATKVGGICNLNNGDANFT